MGRSYVPYASQPRSFLRHDDHGRSRYMVERGNPVVGSGSRNETPIRQTVRLFSDTSTFGRKPCFPTFFNELDRTPRLGRTATVPCRWYGTAVRPRIMRFHL